jgi:zinc/manganese transport system ATP-binding protein
VDLLVFEAVTLGYNGRVVLNNVNLTVKQGQFFGLVGPNGSGKSTLMKSMLGLVRPRSGTITWTSGMPKIGYVPQSELIDPIWPMRVRDLLHLTLCSLEPANFRHKKEDIQVGAVMEWIGIEHLANQTLDTLSGGEMQRVLLARALIIEPEVLFLDEPTAAMDLVSSQKFLILISNLHVQKGMSVIIVTHDLQSLVGRAKSIGIIESGGLYYDTAEKLLTSETLSKIYKQPMLVKTVDDYTLIYPQNEGKGL